MYSGPDKADVQAVFQTLLSEYGFIHGVTAEELTDLFCDLLLERAGNKIMDDLSWGYQ
jgi:hypothetical protein